MKPMEEETPNVWNAEETETAKKAKKHVKMECASRSPQPQSHNNLWNPQPQFAYPHVRPLKSALKIRYACATQSNAMNSQWMPLAYQASAIKFNLEW